MMLTEFRTLSVVLLMIGALSVVGAFTLTGCGDQDNTIRIGTKNFTEQFILGELMAQIIENRTEVTVQRRFNLGGTMIAHGALINDQIDLYAEYTGTALTAVLDEDVAGSQQEVYEIVSEAYQEQFQCEWLPSFGFNNTYALTVREADAASRGWQQISDLAPIADELTAGFTSEFAERPDGYPGLQEAYGFSFDKVSDLDPGLMYQAVANGEVDVISAFSTDGRIVAYKLLPLEDDKGFFPPYYAAPVVRASILSDHPEVRQALELLGGVLDDSTMQQLNYDVDEQKRDPAEVAQEFLTSRELLQ